MRPQAVVVRVGHGGEYNAARPAKLAASARNNLRLEFPGPNSGWIDDHESAFHPSIQFPKRFNNNPPALLDADWLKAHQRDRDRPILGSFRQHSEIVIVGEKHAIFGRSCRENVIVRQARGLFDHIRDIMAFETKRFHDDAVAILIRQNAHSGVGQSYPLVGKLCGRIGTRSLYIFRRQSGIKIDQFLGRPSGGEFAHDMFDGQARSLDGRLTNHHPRCLVPGCGEADLV
jgi:hypothetical protein